MIKIIYGVTDNSSVCELIFPKQDNLGISSLVNQSVIKNDISESMVGEHFYSIYCVGDFYVFSKIIIVYEKSKRISYRAFMIALKSDEKSKGYNILKEITQLESQYTKKQDISQSSTVTDEIKIGNDTATSKQIVAIYYNGIDELEQHFTIKNTYKQYETIYFIDKSLYGDEKDPINALKRLDEVFDSKTFNNYNLQNHANDSEQEDINSSKAKFNEIIKNKKFILGMLMGMLLGILVGIIGFWSYQKLFSDDDVEVNTQDCNYQNIITEKDNQIKKLESEIQILEDSIQNMPKQNITTPTVNSRGNQEGEIKDQTRDSNTPIQDNELQNFLKIECKTMNLNEIIKTINSFRNWTKTKNLMGFANFVTLICKNPPSKIDIITFIKDNQSNFSENDEYVKFVKYLEKQDEIFFDKRTKKIDGINNKTLQDIEKEYGYHQ